VAIVLLKKSYGQSVISETLRQLIEDPDYSVYWTQTRQPTKAKKARGLATAGARRAERSGSRKK